MPDSALPPLSLDNATALFGRPAELKLSEIVRPDIVECPPELSLRDAAARMSEARVSSILVVNGGEVLGIWTERDALRVDFADPASFDRPIREAMSAPVRTVPSSLTLHELTVRFREEHLRHYLVVDEQGRRCGVVSQTDVVMNQGVEHYLKLRKLTSLLKGRLTPLSQEAALSEATRHMREGGADAVVVAYADGGYGILTERDVTRLVAAGTADLAVGELASRPLITVQADTSLYRVRAQLTERRMRHIGVLDEKGGLIDLISFSDILTGMELVYVHELQHALSERDRALNASQRNLYLAEKVIESSLEGILVTDADARIISVNPAFTRLTGYSAEEVIGRNPRVLGSGRQSRAFYTRMWESINADGHWQGEVWNRRKNGEIFPELLTINAIRDHQGRLTNYAALFSDISEVKENQQRIRDLAYYDPLTGLPNRRLLDDRLQVELAHASRHQRKVAVIFVDLDRFKRINDSLGHEVGDQLLVEVASRLRHCLRDDDTVARMGGDEFVVVMSDLDGPDGALHAASRMTAALRSPITVDGRELVVTCSIGISLYPDDGKDSSTLIKNADVAMYRAKAEGRNAFQLYQPAMNARSLEHLALEAALHHALPAGELFLHYQPVISVDDRRIVAAEALLRWRHPNLGVVSPADFIPIAEETGLIVPIGEWVLRTACTQHRIWRESGRVPIRMMVNISARQFRDEGFVDMVRCVLHETAMAPHLLTLELTESILMDDTQQAISLLEELRMLGLRVALDDFGTGYSSLGYLKRFPIDELKIDRLFVRDIDRNPRDAALAAAIISIGHSLGLRVVGEGVETASQFDMLTTHGCDLVQGYHFSLPVAAEAFPE
ncbi:MAG: EAL domain-containing protein [Dechloromonas sp.]|nr:EAL domain-containing protein [Thauera sp.]MBN8461710.1 EAL domain-containing protein [Dechloromonas sp.]